MADLNPLQPPYQNKVTDPDGYMDKGWLAYFTGWANKIVTGAVNAVTGTSGRIKVSGTPTAPVVDIDPAYVASAAQGGTGQSGYAVGDTLYASGPTAVSKLPGINTTWPQILTQTGTGSASAPPAWMTRSQLLQVFNVLDYAPIGYIPGVTDATSAFYNAAAALQANGGGELVIPPGNYLTHTGGLTTVLGAFSNLNGVSIKGCGATITVNRTFTGSQNLSLFTFTACKNIYLSDYRIVSPEEAAGTRDTRGIIAHTFLQGCNGIAVRNIEQTGGIYGLWFAREYNDPESYRTRNIQVDNYRTFSVGYTFMCRHSGDNARASIDCIRPHRAWFMYGVSNVSMISMVQDQDADCILKGYNGAIMRSIRIHYINKNSTAASNAAGDIEIKGNQDGANHSTFEDIDINFDVDYTGQPAFTGPVFLLGNNDASDTANDTADRGHIFDRIRLSGTIKGSSSLVPFAIGTTGSWGLGNYIRGFSMVDMSVYGTGSGSIYLTSLQDKAVIQNLVSDAQMFIKGNTTGIITCMGCYAVNLTAATNDASYMDFIGCQITSGTTISKINKNFLPYHVGSTYEQMGLYRNKIGAPVIARIKNTDNGPGSDSVYEVTSIGSGYSKLGVSNDTGNGFYLATNSDGKLILMKGLDPANNKILVVDGTTLAVQFQNDISIANTATLRVGAVTGSTIGQAGGLIGFLGATPIAQQSNSTALDTLLSNFGFRAAGGLANFAADVSLASGKVIYNNGIQVLAAQQTGMGASLSSRTAGATYDATAQTMLQEAHDKIRLLEAKLKTHGMVAT